MTTRKQATEATTRKQATEAATVRGFPRMPISEIQTWRLASFLEFQTAAYLEGFAGDPAGVGGGYEGHGVGDILWFAETAERGA
jgi:hypothetical protein